MSELEQAKTDMFLALADLCSTASAAITDVLAMVKESE